MSKYKDFLGLGIAGNFALHLAQAGELEEFKDIITAEEAAPKGMFPFYLPYFDANIKLTAKDILTTYPLSSKTIKLPNENVNVQAEPEVALVCELEYKDNKLSQIIPKLFGAYNDCSIRVAGANKISDKKNWGEDSKGFADKLIEIDTFSKGGIMDKYSIASFLRRDSILHLYGENVELNGYSYFYKKLQEWMLHQVQTQEDFGPLESLSQYISACNNPSQAIISIGATRYTEYGEKTFLEAGDEVIIALYPSNLISYEELIKSISNNDFNLHSTSILVQKVI